MTGTQLEQLVVRLVGEGGNYKRVLDDAVGQTSSAAKKIEQLTSVSMGKQNVSMQEAARITQSLATPTERYKRELAEVNRLHRAGAITTQTHTRAVQALAKEYKQGAYAVMAFGRSMTSTGRQIRNFGMMATVGVTMPVVGMVASWVTFDDAMTQSLAIMGDVSAGTRKEMEATAHSIARNSVTSATELAKSYYYLVSAGLDAKQSIAALPVVEKFAVAGAFDMERATTLLVDAQSALGMTSADAAENMRGMLHVSDALTKAGIIANANVQQFSESLTNEAGAAIKNYNMDLSESTAILAAYADQGIKGAVAGSLFGRMTRLLIDSIKDHREVFTSLGIEVDEFASTGKNLTQVIEGITRAVAGMGPVEKAATLEALGFEARIQQAIMPLLGATDKIRKYQKALEDAGGVTAEVAAKQLTSFISQMKIMWNQIKEVTGAIGEQLAPYILKLSDIISAGLVWWRSLEDWVRKDIAIIVGLAAVLGSLAIVLGTVGIAVGGLVTVVGMLGTVFTAVFSPMGAKVTAITAGVVALGYAIVKMTDYIWGPGALVAAFKRLGSVSLEWAKKLIGFIVNIGYNFKVLMEWLPDNWRSVFSDIGQLMKLLATNGIDNIQTMLATFVRLFTLWRGWMSQMFAKVFTVDFWHWVLEGLKKTGNAVTRWAGLVKAVFKSIFSPGSIAASTKALDKFLATSVDDFQEGLETDDIIESMQRIIGEEVKKLKSPFEGFKSTLKDLPKFKTELDIFVDKNKIKDDLVKAVGNAFAWVKRGFKTLEVLELAPKMPKMKDLWMKMWEIPKKVGEDAFAWVKRGFKALALLAPPVPTAKVPKAEKAKEERRTDFKQIALNRISIVGLTGFGAQQREQKVKAYGIERRLDILIDINKRRRENVLAV